MSNNKNLHTMPVEKENKKVILLDLSRTDRAFEEPESLWDIEIEKIEERLVRHIKSLESYKEEKEFHKKPLLSIAILGYPGSGKTSMLRTLAARVNQGKLKKEGLNSNIYSLPVIKPNLVAEDDHFLYAFLAEALKKDRSRHQHEGEQVSDTSIISRVQHKFQDVSEYLQVLNKAGNKHEGDPLGVSLERLERHESGLMLIEKMAEFIDELANSLGTNTKSSVVLLPVDDADMSREVLISALDTCWRFIRHPRLVPIFTFTGRLAEELLRVHYDGKINSGSSSEKLKEASTSLLVTENMALQYLGRLFPVRNRIKMGLAAARVQAAKYKPLKGGDEEQVSNLLKTASILLFGHAHVPIVHPIRPPLRVVTLRRQIQIIDAIQGVGIEDFIKTYSKKQAEEDTKEAQTTGEKKTGEKQKSWGRIYDLTSWSLLNAHRDILKEINLNLDDLYSWTPKGLRQVVLDCLLRQDLDERGKLLKHWRYRTEDRRSQIISLLAANVFRPLMAEEPSGDDGIHVIENWWKEYTGREGECLGDDHDSFSILIGVLWFLNLCVGFYLPLALAWKRLGKTGEKEQGNRVTGIGWDLLSGPTHAVREALKNRKVFSSGILFLDPGQFDKALNDIGPNKNKRFFTHVWCSYGFHDGWPWAAISLWRGLGLIGKVIEFYETHRKNVVVDDKKLKKGISKIIVKHFRSALVSSNLPTGEKIEGYEDFKFEDWEYKDEAKDKEDSMENKISQFAAVLISWLKKYWSITEIEEDGQKVTKKKEIRIFPMKEDRNWESSFIRRLHGESLMSIFWQDLDNAYYKKELNNWSAGFILYRWKMLLSQYWKKCSDIKTLLESCPIWPDYRSYGSYEKEDTEFDWGAVRIYSFEEYEKYAREYITKLEKADKNKGDEANSEKLKKTYINSLEKAYKKKGDEEALKKLKKEHKKEDEAEYIKKLEKADKNKEDEANSEKLKKDYINSLEEAYKKKGSAEALKNLKKKHKIEDEAEYIKELEKADKNKEDEADSEKLKKDYINSLEEAYKKKSSEEALKNLKREHKIENEAEYIKKLEKADKNKGDEVDLEKLKKDYINSLEEAYKKKGGEKALKDLKKDHKIEDEAEYKKELETEEEKLKKEKEKQVAEINKKDVEKEIKEIEKKINNLKKIIKDIKPYNVTVEYKYNQKIGIARAEVENYLLFSYKEKPSKHKLEGDLTIRDKCTKSEAKEEN